MPSASPIAAPSRHPLNFLSINPILKNPDR
jgi:hypothetical protein